MEYSVNLPSEIIKKILMMRPRHLVAELIEFCSCEHGYFYGNSTYNPEDYIFPVDFNFLRLMNLCIHAHRSKYLN